MSSNSNDNRIKQSAAENLQAGRDINIGSINQTVNLRDAVPQPVGIPQNLPYSGAAKFVGRFDEIDTLHQQLQRTDRVAISAVSGMGGVGKTELAIQYALKHLEEYPGGVCWLRARSTNLGVQIVEFAQLYLSLEVPQELGGKSLELDQQVKWCWQHWQPLGTVLLILDDVTDLASCREIIQKLPKRFRVLVTTRQRRLDTSFFELSLDVLSPQASLQLLVTLIGKSRVEREASKAESLCEWLGYLPLGLELVGRYLVEDPDLSLNEMLQRLKDQKLKYEALDLTEQQTQEKYMMTAQRGVKAAFELTWQEVCKPISTKNNLFARFNPIQKLFRKQIIGTSDVAILLTLFSPDLIPWELVLLTTQSLKWSDHNVEDAKKQLYKRHLIQQVTNGYYKVHPLIRQFLQEKLRQSRLADKLKRAFATLMAAIGRQIFQCETRQEYQAFAPVVSHLTEVVSNLKDFIDNQDLIWSFNGLGAFYKHGQLDYYLAENWYKQCIYIIEIRLGNHINLADSCNNLALIYELKSDYDEAIRFHMKALNIYKSILGNSHPQIASSLTQLGDIYFATKNYIQAEELYLKAFEIRKKVLGGDHPKVVNSVKSLFQLYLYQNRLEEAEILLKNALEIRDSKLKKYSDDIASLTANLASLYMLQARFDKAEILLLKALEIYKYLDITNDTATTWSNLAELYLEQKRYSEAEISCKQAIELLKTINGVDHPLVLKELCHLGKVYRIQKRYGEAENAYLKAIESIKMILGKNHLEVAIKLDALASVYLEQKRFLEAEFIYQQVLEIVESRLEKDNPLTAEFLNSLGICYFLQKKYTEAEPIYKQALAINQQAFGLEHEDVALNLHNLSALYDEQGKLDEAVPLCKQAQAIWEKTIGTNDPLYARSLDRLAGIYTQQGKLDEAKSLYERALMIREQRLGLEDADTVSTRQSLEKVYQSLASDNKKFNS